MCSISGLVASSRFAAYNVSKFGLIGMTEALRMEYGRRTLGATALCPGPVKTNLYRSAASGRAKPVPEPPGWLCASAERVAAKGIRGIKKNKRMVLVTPMAYMLYYIKRLVAGLLRSPGPHQPQEKEGAAAGHGDDASGRKTQRGVTRNQCAGTAKCRRTMPMKARTPALDEVSLRCTREIIRLGIASPRTRT